MRHILMWIVIGVIYLFVGFVIGYGLCIHADDDPNDPDSFRTIIVIGVVWPVILIIASMRILMIFANMVAEALCERFNNDNREKEEP